MGSRTVVEPRSTQMSHPTQREMTHLSVRRDELGVRITMRQVLRDIAHPWGTDVACEHQRDAREVGALIPLATAL